MQTRQLVTECRWSWNLGPRNGLAPEVVRGERRRRALNGLKTGVVGQSLKATERLSRAHLAKTKGPFKIEGRILQLGGNWRDPIMDLSVLLGVDPGGRNGH